MKQAGHYSMFSEEIRSLARNAVAALPASSPGAAFARRGIIQPVEYMRCAEFEAILRDLTVRPGMTLMDVSSPQWFSIYVAHKHPAAEVVYTNIIDSEIDPYREIAEALRIPNLRYQKADVRALEFADNSFDRVISISVLEHVYPEVGGDVQAFREIARTLKPGGHLLLTVPYKSQRNVVYKDEAVYERGEKKRNFFGREYDKEQFDELIASSPFSPGNPWYICERKGWFALDYYEWGPGKDVLLAKCMNRARRILERVAGRSLDQTLARRYLDVVREASGRLVNVSVALTKPHSPHSR